MENATQKLLTACLAKITNNAIQITVIYKTAGERAWDGNVTTMLVMDVKELLGVTLVFAK